MKKSISLFLFFIILIGSNGLQAHVGSATLPDNIIAEFRPSYFSPASHKLRKYFYNCKVNYQVSCTVPVNLDHYPWMVGLNYWIAVDYYASRGNAKKNHNCSITLVPTTLGFKYFFPAPNDIAPLNIYLGGGMKFYFVRSYDHRHKNHDLQNRIQKRDDRNGMGAVVEIGCLTSLYDPLILDAFFSYSFKVFGATTSIIDDTIEIKGINVNGANVGVGIGYQF
jgi:outer membrane protein W